MIAIVNISTHSSSTGWHEYELRINAKVIAQFRHKREEGLTKCLERAAEAAEKAKCMKAKALIDALSSNGSRPVGAEGSPCQRPRQQHTKQT
jgi:hypothetical protein